MGRYLNTNLCTTSVDRTLRSYCKSRYLLRKYPRVAKAPPCLDLHRYSLLSAPYPSRFVTNSTLKNLNNIDAGRFVQVVRFYSSSNRDAFKAEAPIGILEEVPSSVELSSLSGRLSQSFDRLSRHINIYFKRKDIVPLAENGSLVLTTPGDIGRSQRRCHSQRAPRETNTPRRKDTTQKAESSGTSPEIPENSGLQLFHISSLATRFGESYSYVANHINSAFSPGFAKVQVQEKSEAMSSTKGTNKRQLRRKILNNYVINSKVQEISQVKSGADQTTVEANNTAISWEESYLHFARHVNKYFGAKVTDDVGYQKRRESLPVENNNYQKLSSTQSTSEVQRGASQRNPGAPIHPETGLFHNSNAATSGENYIQTSRRINRYFGLDEDIHRSLKKEMDSGSAAVEKPKTVSLMDCLRNPSSAIPDLVGAYLKWGPLSQTAKPKPAMTSSKAILNKKVSSCCF